jgi:hypothetical protein
MYGPDFSCLAGIKKEKSGIDALTKDVLSGMIADKKKKGEGK